VKKLRKKETNKVLKTGKKFYAKEFTIFYLPAADFIFTSKKIVWTWFNNRNKNIKKLSSPEKKKIKRSFRQELFDLAKRYILIIIMQDYSLNMFSILNTFKKELNNALI